MLKTISHLLSEDHSWLRMTRCHYSIRAIFALAAVVLLSLGFPISGLAQAGSGEVLIQEGIGDEPERKRRAPVVSVRVEQSAGNVKILADAFVPHRDYQRFPIRFQYFINRGLFASQYRSTTLPGPVGIDVGPDVATPPFNYTVVAEMITPFGENYSTVLEGAVFATSLTGNFQCELEEFGGLESELTFQAEDVVFIQEGNNSVRFSATFRSDENGDSREASASLQLSTAATLGTLNLTGDGVTREFELTGNAQFDSESGLLSAVELSNSDGTLTLDCDRKEQSV